MSKTETVVRVPEVSVDAYKAADYWQEFWNIGGDTTTGIASHAAGCLRTDGKAYTLSGTEAKGNCRGIVIINGRKTRRK